MKSKEYEENQIEKIENFFSTLYGLRFTIFAFCIFMVCGCTYIGPGIYHRVSEGETIWDISTAYGSDIKEIVRANRLLKNSNTIKAGEMIYVPGAKYAKKVHRSSLNFIWPVKGKIIQKFGRCGNKRYLGIGIKSKEGTPVVAVGDGRVIFVSEDFRSYGKTIIIEHNKNYTTVYAHNKINFVREDQDVKKGEKIAEVGMTGWAGKPNLYFEIRYREKPKNPLFILP